MPEIAERRDYSQHIMPLKYSIIYPEKVSKTTKSSDYPEISQPSGLIDTDDDHSLFHKINQNASVHIDIKKEGIYRLESGEDDDVVQSVRIDIGPSVKASVIIKVSGNGFCSQFIESFIAEGAALNLIVIQDKGAGTYASKQALKLESDARVNFLHADKGAALSVVEQKCYLDGEGAVLRNYTLARKDGKQRFDLNTASIHRHRLTDSNLETATVLEGNSSVIVRALVQIDKVAGDSKGFQKQEALLLSDDCKISSVPDLLIHNNDVSCSHSSSISRIDKEQKFYMMSRGIDELTAISILKEAFIKAHVAKLARPELEAEILEALGA